MGYTDISIYGSDMASDTNAIVGEATDNLEKLSILTVEVSNPHNCYNTPGPVNVALCLLDGNGQHLFDWALYGKVIDGLKGLINDETSSNDPCSYHIREYNKLLNRMKEKIVTRMSHSS